MLLGMNAHAQVTTAQIRDPLERIEPVRQIPFVLMHILPFAAIYTGTRWQDWAVCIGLYYARMVFVTLGYHRYFSHKTFKMGRAMQFLVAFGAESSSQKGALWWAANHRHHHRYSDQPEDVRKAAWRSSRRNSSERQENEPGRSNGAAPSTFRFDICCSRRVAPTSSSAADLAMRFRIPSCGPARKIW